ncbi:MAG TPA: hypothetical protein PLT76_06820 [Candidatus Omnitrophota bacterium]|nr:hypothetical protein [Candidatus Omnitrophota bacterium]HQO58419.1 hypothetical protein [Candidatus Omnitrophota bacterium]HQP12082.1 hypothetical protein [Candidatus Omnitrophota bacterium]
MKNRYYQVVLLYVRHLPYRILALSLLGTAVLSRFSLEQRLVAIADDFFTFFVVVSVWLAFTAGVLLKRQMAQYRASLLPYYRAPHIIVPFMFFAFFVIVFGYWLVSLYPIIIVNAAAVWSVFVLCALVISSVIWVGYLSINMLVYLSYFFLLVLSRQAYNLVVFVTENIVWQPVLGLASVVLMLVLARRAMSLQEESFEYGYMMSWPQKEFLHNQIKADELYTRGVRTLRKRLGLRPVVPALPPYPRRAALWRRALHWHRIDFAELKSVWVALLVLTPVYMAAISRFSLGHGLFDDPYNNFLLYTVAPVLLVLCVNHRNMTTWSYDILKPVRKEDFLRDQGLVLLGGLGLYWSLFVLYLILIPHLIFKPAELALPRFWGYILLTGSFALLTLSWVIFMSCYSSRPWFVIIHGSLLCALAQVLFMVSGHFYGMTSLGVSLVCWLGVYMFLKSSYRKWCEAEFI